MIRPSPRKQPPSVPPHPRHAPKSGEGRPRTRPTPRSRVLEASSASPHLRDAAPKRRETEIQAAILRYLDSLPGVFARRMNSRVVRMPGKGGRSRLVRFGFEGCPDILGWRHEDIGVDGRGNWCDVSVARFLAIEVKRAGEEPSPAQAAFLERVRQAGGLAVVATCVEDVKNALAC